METSSESFVFISWSGESSKKVAEALRTWLPDVIQSLNVWMSAEDINAGARWNDQINRNLGKSKFGILCLTKENLDAPWLNFEAGALAKSIDNSESFVCPFLFDLEKKDIPSGPLSQFQAISCNKEDTLELVRSINKALGVQLKETQLERSFERCWVDLEKILHSIPKNLTQKIERSLKEMVEEILLIVRGIAYKPNIPKSTIHHTPDLELITNLINEIEKNNSEYLSLLKIRGANLPPPDLLEKTNNSPNSADSTE